MKDLSNRKQSGGSAVAMSAIVAGFILAVGLAVGAAFVLDWAVQRSTTDRFRTDAVRL
jgi:hypothetical protein